MLEAQHQFRKESNQTTGNIKVQISRKSLEKTSWVTESDLMPFQTIFLVYQPSISLSILSLLS